MSCITKIYDIYFQFIQKMCGDEKNTLNHLKAGFIPPKMIKYSTKMITVRNSMESVEAESLSGWLWIRNYLPTQLGSFMFANGLLVFIQFNFIYRFCLFTSALQLLPAFAFFPSSLKSSSLYLHKKWTSTGWRIFFVNICRQPFLYFDFDRTLIYAEHAAIRTQYGLMITSVFRKCAELRDPRFPWNVPFFIF